MLRQYRPGKQIELPHQNSAAKVHLFSQVSKRN